MTHEPEGPIVAGSREFADLAELRAFVSERIGKGIFDPDEQRAIETLAKLDGDGIPFLQEIARNLEFVKPSRPPKGPTPLDDVIAQAEADLADADAELGKADRTWRDRAVEVEDAFRRALAKAGRNGTAQMRVQADFERYRAEVADLRADFYLRDEKARRARVRLNALRLRRDRWRQMQEARFCHPARPGEALTLEELGELREREGR